MLIIIGTLLILIPSLVETGATILGCGIGTLPAAYQTVRDQLKLEGRWPVKGTAFSAIGELLLLIIGGFALSKWHWEAFVLELLLVELGSMDVVWKLPNPWPKQTQIGSGRISWRQMLSAILVFLMAFAARGLKQTGLMMLVWLLLAMWLIMLAGFSQLQKKTPTYRMWTFIVGAINSGFMIYNVFALDASGKQNLLIAAFLSFILGLVGGLIGVAKLKWLRDRRHLSSLLIISGICLLIPNDLVYLSGFFLLVASGSAINTIVWHFYQADQRIAINNQRFIRLYYNVLGSISAQVCLLAIIVFVNFIYNRRPRQILQIYYQHLHQAGGNLATPLWWVRVIGVIILAIVMIICWPRLEKFVTNDTQSKDIKR